MSCDCYHIPLRRVVMGGDEISPDKKEEGDGRTEYTCSWFTNGYQPTKKGVSPVEQA